MHLEDFKLISVPVDFRLSWGKPGYSRHVFVTLQDDKGKVGIGEGVLYKTTHLQLLPFLKKVFPINPEALVSFEPALAFAVDTAVLSIQGKLSEPNWNYPVVREIFLEDKNLKEKVKRILSLGSRTVKVKVGAGIGKDKRAIEKIVKYSDGKLKINLDANCAYSLSDAIELALWGRKNNVVLFEEPINGDFAAVRKFREKTGMKVMLDESIQDLSSLDRAISAECFDVLNVKLSRLGGISLAQKYISRCQKAGVRIYLGCSEELEIGTSAIFTLAKSIKGLYGIEGFGRERISFHNGFNYKQGDNRGVFLLKEFIGVWKTRIENIYLKLFT